MSISELWNACTTVDNQAVDRILARGGVDVSKDDQNSIYLPREGGTVWVYSPRGTSRGVSKPILSRPLVGGISFFFILSYHFCSISVDAL